MFANIRLCEMSRFLNRTYFRKFAYDPDVFEDMSDFRSYHYNQGSADAYWQRQRDMGRVHFAVMRGFVPIGEVILKNIDRDQRCCTLGIHLRNDSVKNKGYGTAAEILALGYAFEKLQCEVVYADAILKNTRSQHVLEKVGFRKINQDERFVYYKCEKTLWCGQMS